MESRSVSSPSVQSHAFGSLRSWSHFSISSKKARFTFVTRKYWVMPTVDQMMIVQNFNTSA